jgi:nucleoside-diphosphate-sugar epimerase
MSAGAKAVLITGGDGYLGSSVAARYLEDGDQSVVLWFRAANAEEFQNKKAALQRRFAAHGGRVSYAAGDLSGDDPFRSLDPRGIGAIVHAAAVTRFNVDEETARRVNVDGARKVFRLAAACPSLEAFGLLSTVYASGLAPGVIAEAGLGDGHGFSNFYEWSKWASEAALLKDFGDLPWRIFRVATIIADDERGTVRQQNAFHNTLKLLYYGLLSVIPGLPETPLYLVSGEFVSRAIFALMRRPSSRVIYHVCHKREEALRLGELVDIAFEVFSQSEDFRLRRILKPLYADLGSFELLADGVEKFSGGVVSQAVASVAPFARQLFIDKDLENTNLTAALGRYPDPELRRLAGETCRRLVESRWKPQGHDAR